MKRYTFFLLTPFFLLSCIKGDESISPQISCSVREQYLKSLPSPFKPLSRDERASDWGKEYRIGLKFAEKLDLYPALTAFRRADCLVDEGGERQQEINYYILYCYYLGKKYEDVIETFETTSLCSAHPTFPPFNDLLIMLYESYEELGFEQKAQDTYRLINEYHSKESKKIELGSALRRGDISGTKTAAVDTPYEKDVNELIEAYSGKKKSVKQAKTLNALMPGAGFFYLGQKQSAITAFALNALFTAAAIHSFHKHNYAAGVIFTSFEAGWYFGGIYGAGENAKLYNERIWEKEVSGYMYRESLFPTLMLKYSF